MFVNFVLYALGKEKNKQAYGDWSSSYNSSC